MANPKDSGKIDSLTGMPHSEAHYFNRCATPQAAVKCYDALLT